MDGAKPERDVVAAVLAAIESRLVDPFSLEGLTEVESDLLSGVTAKGVIGNGGHVYWFEGMDAKATHNAASAFDRMGLPEVARAMRESLRAFPGGAPPEPLAERQRYVSLHRQTLERTFGPLDKTVWDADFATAAMRYIDEHRTQLIATAPEYAEILRPH